MNGSNPSDENSALVHYILVHRDDFAMNIKLQIFQYLVSLAMNDSSIYGVQLIMQSSVEGPEHIDWRVESLLKSFESKLSEISDEEFKVRCVNQLVQLPFLKRNVTALIDMKLGKPKELEGGISLEIQSGILKFNRKEAEVAALRYLQKQELIDFFEEYIKIGAARQHLKEKASDENEVPSPSVEIEDIVGFRNSQPLHRSFRGCGQLRL
ncbi:hypothetical protein HID58_052349 [Brassica napus]|uniref:Uncharacterized protein n=1 Tax=Brassica napus TaxID=3708 RepID=A0ABQ8ABJ0_BRANA|nr:hypothetical protein HID58_052349 [Brassica napus]